MSTMPTSQTDHPAYNLPQATEHYQGKSMPPPMPDHMSGEWIDRAIEKKDFNYNRPVNTGSDFIP